jgi:hypothetical protein
MERIDGSREQCARDRQNERQEHQMERNQYFSPCVAGRMAKTYEAQEARRNSMSRQRNGIPFIDQLLCTPDDEAHRQYFMPLADAEDEAMAISMADAVYSACAEGFAPDLTQEEADRVYQQNLADARRMIYDAEYAAMFELLE